MTTRPLTLILLFLLGVLFWLGVGRIEGVGEPWDGDWYWVLWYPLSLLLAAGAGFVVGRRGWLAGAILTFAQLPVMWLNTGGGALMIVGLLFLAVLAIPPVIVAALAGRLAVRGREA